MLSRDVKRLESRGRGVSVQFNVAVKCPNKMDFLLALACAGRTA